MKLSLFFVYSRGFLTVFVVYSCLNCLFFCAQPTIALRIDPGEEFLYDKTLIFGVFWQLSMTVLIFVSFVWFLEIHFIIIKITQNYL